LKNFSERSNEEEMETVNGDDDDIIEKHVISLENHNKPVTEFMLSHAEDMEVLR
jgi:hypothetical protein